MDSERFDRKAGEWDNKPQRRELAAAVAEAIEGRGLDPAMRILDFGCGTGLVSLPLARRVAKVVALDSSSGMLEVLQDKLEAQRIDNVDPLLGDIVTLDLQGGFDLIITSMTLHHIGEIAPVLQSFHRLLKSGGAVAIADLDAEDGSFHQEHMGEKHHGFSRRKLDDHLQQAGFAAADFQTVHTITKTVANGATKNFSVFLAVAPKP